MDGDEMQAGRELDAWIADKIMEQTDYEHDEIGETATGRPYCIRCREVGDWGDSIFSGSKCIRFYSTDIAAAWQVLEKIAGQPGREIVDVRFYHGRYAVLFPLGNIMSVVCTADTAPLAICLAARKSVVSHG